MVEPRRRLTFADLGPRRAALPPELAKPVPAKPVPAKPVPNASARAHARASVAVPAQAKPSPPPAAPPAAPRSGKPRKPSRWARYRAEFGSDTINQLVITFTQRWDATFTDPPRPLAVGIHHDIVAAMNADPLAIAVALHDWTQRSLYLQALGAGGERYGLDGSAQGCVTEKEQMHAKQSLATRATPKLRRTAPARSSDRQSAH